MILSLRHPQLELRWLWRHRQLLSLLRLLLLAAPAHAQSSCAAGTADLDGDGICHRCMSSVLPNRAGYHQIDIMTTANDAAGCEAVSCFTCSRLSSVVITVSGHTTTMTEPGCSRQCGCFARCPGVEMLWPSIVATVSCSVLPPAVADMTITLADGKEIGNQAVYTCTAGGVPTDGDGTRTCQSNGLWTGVAPAICCTPGQRNSESACVDCAVGRYQPSTGQGSCIDCIAGQSSTSGSTSCTNCAAGQFSGTGTVCVDCAVGRYQPSTGQGSCIDCTAGQSSTSRSTSCTNCVAGRYSSSGSSCTNCVAGRSSTSRSSSCSNCVAGMYSSSGGACIACAANRYSGSGSSSCTNCAAGRYSSSGSSSCSNCAAGQSSSSGNACSNCAVGRYSSSGSSCTNCGAGQYASNAGSSSCSSCAGGRYSSAGSSSCSICAAGRYSRSDHAGCTTCANGQNSDSMSTSCQACSARSDCQCDVVAINQPLAGADDYCGPCTSVGGSGSYYFITDSCRDRFAPAGLQATIQQRRNGATIYNGGAKVWRDDPDSSHVPAHYDATVTMGRRDPGGGQWAIGDVIIFVW